MDSKRYKKLLKLQSLIAMRDKMILANLHHEQNLTEERRKSLLASLEKQPNSNIADNLWFFHSLKNNTIKKSYLEQKIADQKEIYKISYKRRDLVAENYKDLSQAEEQKLENNNTNDYVVTKIIKNISFT